MSFNPSSLITLKSSDNSIVVPRNLCRSYDVGYSYISRLISFFRDVLSSYSTAAKQGTIAVAQRNLKSLQSIPQGDLTLMVMIPNHPDRNEIEVSKEAWPFVSEHVQYVVIALRPESGA
jgi:hypothetical protein